MSISFSNASLFWLLIGIMTLTACATSKSKNSDCLSTAVYIPENAWYYQGPGAAASFMLMSSSGPMGAAIGVAIDQGIQKDLLEGMDDPVEIVFSAAKEGLNGVEMYLLSEEDIKNQNPQWRIEWNQFGFRSDMSSERVTYPVMKATVYQYGVEFGTYSLSDGEVKSFAHSLDELIENSELANQVILQAAGGVVDLINADVFTATCSL